MDNPDYEGMTPEEIEDHETFVKFVEVEQSRHQGRERQDKLEALMDETSPAQIAEMLEAICREKAQHLAVNWQDDETATMWERHARVFGNAAIRAHGIGNPYGGA